MSTANDYPRGLSLSGRINLLPSTVQAEHLWAEYLLWRHERGLEPTDHFFRLVEGFDAQVRDEGFPLMAVPNEEPEG